jgi:hypothetical protein
MSYRKGLKVWVEEKGEGWVEAEVAEAKERAVVVLTSQRKKVHHQPILPPFVCRFRLIPCGLSSRCAVRRSWWMRMSPLCLFGVVADLNLEAILVFGACLIIV